MSDKLAQEIDKKILAHYLDLDASGNFKHPPKNDDELWEFVHLAYGLRMPRKVVTKGHSSPCLFVCDLFFERVKNALGFANRTGGKCLALDTDVLTSQGFQKLRDLRVGDSVFAPSGEQTRITTVSEVHTNHKCYRLKFDAETFVADEDHLWEVRCTGDSEFRLMSTAAMYAFYQNPPKTKIGGAPCRLWARRAEPLHFEMQKLHVPPYVLGIYLGDGCRSDNTFCSNDQEIVDRVRELYPFVVKEYPQKDGRCRKFNLLYLRELLRHEGVEAPETRQPKVVPRKYLLSSISQRMELLRGLMDSDGWCAKDKRVAEFSSTDPNLTASVGFLVSSLGGKPRYYDPRPGQFGGYEYKDVYFVRFVPDFGNPFYLPRKASRVISPEDWLRRGVGKRLYSKDHQLIEIEPVASVPVQCIGVDHPSHLFLAGKSLVPTHNTLSVALLNHLDLVFKRNCEIASAGAVRDQAHKCYRYFVGFCELPWFQDLALRFQRATGRPFVEQSILARTVLGNGSQMEIITGTEKGLRGPHPHKARIDEIDLIPWEVLQTGLSMATSSSDIRGQNVFTSTRQLQDGSMQRMLDEAAEKGISVYEWNIWEVLERCGRRCIDDPKHGSCPIYTFCQGKAHHCDGFLKIDDFIDKVRLLDRDKFETEWLNSRPSRHKLVYQHFDNGRHVLTPQKLLKLSGLSQPSASWYRISGLDFGSSPGHPFVYLKLCRIPNVNAWVVYHEYIAEQRLIRDHAAAIKRSPHYLSGEVIYADWDAQDRLELRANGVYTRQAVKGQNTVNMGVDHVSSLLKGFPPREEPMLYVWHECAYTIKEFGKYEWPVRPDGKPDRTGNPMKENDHAMDALRYALYSYKKVGSQKYFGKTISGV